MRMLLSNEKSDPYALSYLAAMDFSEGGLFDAENELLEAISLFPACPESYYNLGLVQLKMNKTEEALKAFEKASSLIAFAETTALGEHTSLKLFDTLVLLGRNSEATRLIKKFLEDYPSHPDALQKLRKLEARGE